MVKPNYQRGSLVIMELGILAALLVTTGIVLTQVQQAKSKEKTKSNTNQAQTGQKKSISQPVNSTTSPQSTPTQSATTPENLNSAPPLGGSGIKGQIYAGAATGCYSPDPNSSCNQPRTQAGTVIIKGPNGIIQAVKSNSSGYFLVSTGTGSFTAELQGSTGSPTTVEVKAGIYSEITLYVN